MTKTPTTDFTVRNEGSIFLLYPNTRQARLHLFDNAGEAQWFGEALAVEHRFIADLVGQLQENGFTVR
jgi:hypothetical protein